MQICYLLLNRNAPLFMLILINLLLKDKIKKGLKGYFTNKIVIIITHSKQFILDTGSIYRLIDGNLLPES